MKKNILLLLFISILNIGHTPIVKSDSIQQSMKINLYIYPGCPYCKKVTQFLEKHGWLNKVTIINANISKNYAMLQKLSNNEQCPFLNDEIHGVNMLESKAIIEYLNKLFSAE